MSDEVRRRVIRLAARGRTYREIIDEAGVSMGSVFKIVKPLGGVIRPELWSPSPARLSLDERVNIKVWLEGGESFAEIGRRLGRATSTISREVGGDWGRALQMTLLFAGLVLLGVLLFSGAQRARLRVFVSKHLFPYRYDYRNEWRRFTQALSAAEGGLDLGQSVIRALAAHGVVPS